MRPLLALTPLLWVRQTWAAIAAAEGGFAYLRPSEDGARVAGAIVCFPGANEAVLVEALRECDYRFLRVSLVGFGTAEVLVARIEDTLRRARERSAPIEPATEDVLVTAQVTRAKKSDPLRALRVLASTERELVRRGALTPERGAALKSAIINTKAALRGERN